MLVNSREVVREGLRAVIEQEPDLFVAAQAATVRDARNIGLKPGVIVTDIDLPDASFDDVVSGFREVFAESSIVIFTSVAEPSEVRSAFTAGADGYLVDTAESTDLVAAIRAVAAGEKYIQPSLGVTLARSRQSLHAALGLSAQEERVLRLLVLGHTNVAVARLSNVSLRTAESLRAQVQRKLDRNTRAELVDYAREHGLFQFGLP